MSGLRATLGGGLGNNATGHGQGDINDDLLGVQVVLPNGQILETGARATSIDAPVVRNYGPDLTGLFVRDAGALGIETQATFRLHLQPARFAVAAWGFSSENALVDAICEMARLGVATDVIGFGAYHHRILPTNRSRRPPRRRNSRELLLRVPVVGSAASRASRRSRVTVLCRPCRSTRTR
jgi:D-lactate dehydrogenase (cytochrome)